MRTRAVAIWSAVLLSAVTQHARIESAPAAAKVYVNDQLVVVTPLEYEVPRGGGDSGYRIEKDEYHSQSGSLRRGTCLTCPLQGFQQFTPVDAVLQPAPSEPSASNRRGIGGASTSASSSTG